MPGDPTAAATGSKRQLEHGVRGQGAEEKTVGSGALHCWGAAAWQT